MLAGCANHRLAAPPPPGTAPTGTAVATPAGPHASRQVRQTWRFDEDGIRFDNLLPAARMSGVTRLGEGTYRIDVAPEVHPVNPSPWYGFRIHSEEPRTLDLRISYPHGHRHRYLPKLSGDGRDWREAGPQAFHVDADGNGRLSLQLDAGELRVFAQPPYLPEDFGDWMARIASQVDTAPRTFGASVQGRPLQMFEFGAGADAPTLLVLGRQHPPENTGTLALTGFVEALAADTPQARAFRRNVHVLVVPLLNPDGVVEGHWRSNANGVDLNRDWGPFAQPETRAMRDMLASRDGAIDVAFAIDFHSTVRDVFYTVTEDPSRGPGGLLQAWMAAMQSRFDIEERPSAARSAVFKNWAFCRFGAPVVTYEVGDSTPRDVLDDVARHAAQSLMVLLAEPRPRAPAPACPSWPAG